jgi:UDP-2,3-diacylglucosamine pyrophosphatase LpxH
LSARSYLVVSDLHLMDVEEHDDGWKRYKSRRYHVDDELAVLVADWLAGGPPGAEHTLVLNGDIFDFDLVSEVPEAPPWPVSREERKRGLHPTEEKSAYKLARMVADHPLFIQTLGRVVAAGGRVVYTFGNHDRELHFDGVKAVLQEAVAAAARTLGAEVGPEDAIVFEPWFFCVPGELYAEHGNQYDRFSSFRYVLDPVYEDASGEEIAIPMGDLSCRYLLNRMGFFNPHNEDFMLSFFAYLAHWARHYAMKGRSLIRSWVWGSLLVLLRSLSTRRRVAARGGARHAARRRELAERVGLPVATVEQLDAGRQAPVTDHKFRLLRELWLDRLLIATAMTGGTVALALVSIPLWIQLVVPLAIFPLLFLLYEAAAHESTQVDFASVPDRARRVAELTGCKVVAFGHTHAPMLVPIARGTSFVNTGTWAPEWRGQPGENAFGKRNWAEVTAVDGAVEARIGSWSEARAPESPSLPAPAPLPVPTAQAA